MPDLRRSSKFATEITSNSEQDFEDNISIPKMNASRVVVETLCHVSLSWTADMLILQTQIPDHACSRY